MGRRNWSGSSDRLQALLPLALIAALSITAMSGALAASKTSARSKSGSKSSASAKPAKTPPSVTKEPPASDAAMVTRWMSSLTLREKIAQLIVIPFNGHPFRPRSRDYAKFVKLVSREHVGGLILVNMANGRVVAKADPVETAGFINRMQRLTKVPLIVAGDFERGASMRIEGTTIFPHAMAFAASGDPEEARLEAEITAKESRAMGFQWLFFPDADVNNNPDNPIINIRSYGEDPAVVSKFVSAFIDGAHSDPNNRVLVTAKHFPGHGDTATDTHMNLATITADLPRLQALEWTPFRSAIASNVDSIMTAHIAVPALDDAATPATLSPKILTGILRDQLGFEGLIVTDALEMGGIAHGFTSGEAAVKALEAGADVLLMPADPLAAIDAVAAAVKAGQITEQRIEQSVTRILTAKARVGLGANKLVDVSRIGKIVNAPESNAAAQRIADRSVTLVRNQEGSVPVKSAASAVFYILKEGPASVEGAAFSAEVRKRVPLARIIQADSFMPDTDLTAAVQHGEQADRYVVAAFASVAANRGTAALGGGLPKLVQALIDTKRPVIFLSLGNPYLLRNFPEAAAYMATYSTVAPSEIAAVKALFGEIAIEGKLPVSIPGFAQTGDGIMLPPQDGCCAARPR
jgi:beta-N-acetylhexosaminidase